MDDTKQAPGLMTTAVVLISVYIAIQMMADIAATKAITLGPLTMDGGIIYSLTFTWRDLIHKRLGIRAARAVVLAAAGINVMMALYFRLVVALEPTEGFVEAGGQAAWGFIFGEMLSRVVFASIIAEVIAELTDTEIYRLWMESRTRRLPQWLRVLVSNAVSIPLDSALFVVVAFAGVLPGLELWDMFASNIVTKGALSLASMWLIYLVHERPDV